MTQPQQIKANRIPPTTRRMKPRCPGCKSSSSPPSSSNGVLLSSSPCVAHTGDAEGLTLLPQCVPMLLSCQQPTAPPRQYLPDEDHPVCRAINRPQVGRWLRGLGRTRSTRWPMTRTTCSHRKIRMAPSTLHRRCMTGKTQTGGSVVPHHVHTSWRAAARRKKHTTREPSRASGSATSFVRTHRQDCRHTRTCC